MKKIKKILYDIGILSIPFYLNRVFKIKKNKIIFSNFYGNGYGDNPKYICDELLKSGKKYDIVWVVKKNIKQEFPDNIRTVKVNTLKYIYELSTAKIWVFNCRKNRAIKKRKEQYYIQTWHGGIALKKIEKDAEDKLDKNYITQAKEDSEAIDLMISNSEFCTNMYKNAFWYNKEIAEVGSPRSDVFINADKLLIKRAVCAYYNLSENTQILLYTPTFRDNYLKNPYDIDFTKMMEILEKKTGREWITLVRLHPKENYPEKFIRFSKKIKNVTNYRDVQELIMSSSLLITDYSSTMFDAMISNNNILLYANDIENYNNERGMYFKFEQLPFHLATNNQELIDILKDINFQNKDKKYFEFEKQIGLKENGTASKCIAEIIERKINE